MPDPIKDDPRKPGEGEVRVPPVPSPPVKDDPIVDPPVPDGEEDEEEGH